MDCPNQTVGTPYPSRTHSHPQDSPLSETAIVPVGGCYGLQQLPFSHEYPN
uniref:Uncharacterized protein n=1 Tax=Anguilla anguilla TaxID=7936 RepID=A0A0E9S2K6_ANGAN